MECVRLFALWCRMPSNRTQLVGRLVDRLSRATLAGFKQRQDFVPVLHVVRLLRHLIEQANLSEKGVPACLWDGRWQAYSQCVTRIMDCLCEAEVVETVASTLLHVADVRQTRGWRIADEVETDCLVLLLTLMLGGHIPAQSRLVTVLQSAGDGDRLKQYVVQVRRVVMMSLWRQGAC